jgi:hypothetical protein
MKQWVFWAGAAIQVALFQLILWFALGGQRHTALWLTGAALSVGVGLLVLYMRGVSRT